MSAEISRDYRMEDEEMIVRSQVIHDQFVTDLPLFTAKFPFLTSDTATALQTGIDTIEALKQDREITALLKVLTESVNAQVVLGRNALTELNTYAKFTYPTNKAQQRAFGQDYWKEAYNDQEKMMNALEQAHSIAAQQPFAIDLNAKGFTALMTENLLIIANNIRSKNRLQEDAKTNRTITTYDRIGQYNSVWAQIKNLSMASKVVFVDNPAKIHAYLLYPNNTTNTTVNITVLNASTGEPMQEAILKLTNTSLAAQTTNERGVATFESVNMPEMVVIEVTSADGAITIIENQSITPGTTNDLTVEAEG